MGSKEFTISENMEGAIMNSKQQQIPIIPEHLQQYIVDQNYDSYSPIDHAIWRYVMRVNRHFFKQFAHEIYLHGLEQAGIREDRIPRIEEMDAVLNKIGWRAVCVDGFIPSKSFMEFQALQILPIAADIRAFNHIAYTPSPDILHEAAGHAPIIADKDYAQYLKHFGEVGQKAIFYPEDLALYEAIRHLSFIKEKNPTPEAVAEAEAGVQKALDQIVDPSEANLLMRLHWWTVEYGLIGDLKNPKIYGAGLLSSVGESQSCLSDSVTKIPLDINCINYAFDITKEQPQLFVATQFSELNDVLTLFTSQMAYKQGGIMGMRKAIKSKSHCTVETSDGLQLTGIFNTVQTNDKEEIEYIKGTSSIITALNNKEINRFNSFSFCDGFEFPVGELCGLDKSLALLSDEELKAHHYNKGENVELNYKSGISIHGILKHWLRKDGIISQITLEDCFVIINDHSYYKGEFTFPVVNDIKSVYAGSADPESLEMTSYVSPEKFDDAKIKYDHDLIVMYQMMREIRKDNLDHEIVYEVFDKLHLYPEDWLLRLEALEIIQKYDLDKSYKERLENELSILARNPNLQQLISNGLEIIK